MQNFIKEKRRSGAVHSDDSHGPTCTRDDAVAVTVAVTVVAAAVVALAVAVAVAVAVALAVAVAVAVAVAAVVAVAVAAAVAVAVAVVVDVSVAAAVAFIVAPVLPTHIRPHDSHQHLVCLPLTFFKNMSMPLCQFRTITATSLRYN